MGLIDAANHHQLGCRCETHRAVSEQLELGSAQRLGHPVFPHLICWATLNADLDFLLLISHKEESDVEVSGFLSNTPSLAGLQLQLMTPPSPRVGTPPVTSEVWAHSKPGINTPLMIFSTLELSSTIHSCSEVCNCRAAVRSGPPLAQEQSLISSFVELFSLFIASLQGDATLSPLRHCCEKDSAMELTKSIMLMETDQALRKPASHQSSHESFLKWS